MTLTEEPSGLWRLDTGGTLIGYDAENLVYVMLIETDIGTDWTVYADLRYRDGTAAVLPLARAGAWLTARIGAAYMIAGWAQMQIRGVMSVSLSEGSDPAELVKKSNVARVLIEDSVNASEELPVPGQAQWDIYAAQVAGYRDAAAAAAAAAQAAAGKMPRIGDNGTWETWDAATDAWVDSGVEAKGQDGVTPDIQIGTVTTLPAGSEATASMSGTAAQPLLNLGIPKGDKGDKGSPGTGGGGDSGYITDVSEDFDVSDAGRLSLNKAEQVQADNTHPITAAAVYVEVGNINALLGTI